MEKVAVDVLGPLPPTKRGNKFVLVIVDTFTKWTEAVAIPNQEATDGYYGVCRQLCDQVWYAATTSFGSGQKL